VIPAVALELDQELVNITQDLPSNPIISEPMAASATILTDAETKFINQIRQLRDIHPYAAGRVLDLETFKVYLVRSGIINQCNPYAIQRQYDGHSLGLFKTTTCVDGNEEENPTETFTYN
jgi:hypothetical protein